MSPFPVRWGVRDIKDYYLSDRPDLTAERDGE